MANYMKSTASSRARANAKAQDRAQRSSTALKKRSGTNRSARISSGRSPNYMRSTISSRAKSTRHAPPSSDRSAVRHSHASTTQTGHVESSTAVREDHRPKSKKPFFWAQGSSRDMLTQAIARNVIAISKQQHEPDRKQSPGVVLTPNQTVGQRMAEIRDDVVQGYEFSVARSARDRDNYAGFHANARQTLNRLNTQLKSSTNVRDRTRLYSETLEQRATVRNLKAKVNEYSREHSMFVERLDAARRTQVSWPGHESWGGVVSEMASTPSKLLTLGHGNRNTGFVAEEIARNRPDQLHQFGDIVDAQKASGLPLDVVAKRLDACHGSANPLKPEMVAGLQEVEQRKVIPTEDRNYFLGRSSATQQFAQAYHDRGVLRPEVKGADTTVTRFPNTPARPVHHNEVELPSGARELRSRHVQVHGPVFLNPSSTD